MNVINYTLHTTEDGTVVGIRNPPEQQNHTNGQDYVVYEISDDSSSEELTEDVTSNSDNISNGDHRNVASPRIGGEINDHDSSQSSNTGSPPNSYPRFSPTISLEIALASPGDPQIKIPWIQVSRRSTRVFINTNATHSDDDEPRSTLPDIYEIMHSHIRNNTPDQHRESTLNDEYIHQFHLGSQHQLNQQAPPRTAHQNTSQQNHRDDSLSRDNPPTNDYVTGESPDGQYNPDRHPGYYEATPTRQIRDNYTQTQVYPSDHNPQPPNVQHSHVTGGSSISDVRGDHLQNAVETTHSIPSLQHGFNNSQGYQRNQDGYDVYQPSNVAQQYAGNVNVPRYYAPAAPVNFMQGHYMPPLGQPMPSGAFPVGFYSGGQFNSQPSRIVYYNEFQSQNTGQFNGEHQQMLPWTGHRNFSFNSPAIPFIHAQYHPVNYSNVLQGISDRIMYTANPLQYGHNATNGSNPTAAQLAQMTNSNPPRNFIAESQRNIPAQRMINPNPARGLVSQANGVHLSQMDNGETGQSSSRQ